ncbi:MAG TPA: FUSC family protein [Solirubrobacteraceae bacterium]|nr:FUSC family protein [Solirubrobacteraceae bacterium]
MGRGSVFASPATALRPVTAGREWLRRHDPGYAALRRAARAALVMPIMFALGDKVIGDPALATFAAFGSFAMLLLVDFSGSIRDRLLDQTGLAIACAVLICLGTLVSRTTWLAAAAMAVIAFAILFAGVVSSVLAGATTSLLLAFILPVALPAPASAIPARVAGWGLAAAASLLAISLLWPSPSRNPVRGAAIGACRALARRLRAEVDYVMSSGAGAAREAHREAVADARDAVQGLLRVFFSTPYRPTGLTTDARAVVRLVDELRWLETIVLRSAPAHHPPRRAPAVCTVKVAAADVLDRTADVLEEPRDAQAGLTAALDRMHEALTGLEQAATAALPTERPPGSGDDERARTIVSSLDPSFRAQELTFVVDQIAANTSFAAAAAQRRWIERLLGRQPAGFQGPVTAAHARAGAHVDRHSVWLHNSLRGAAALGLAVLVADLSSVQHGFWVVFGTLSVLRSNALSTGQNTLRALLGTTAGFVIGGIIVYLIGTDTSVLWALLPIAILIAGLAPATISFAAGQAGFTLTLLILFNILAPEGWKIGLVRIEDIALGGAVSLAVGLLFWPRGAAALLGTALADAYAASARYLAAAVAYGVGCCDASGGRSPVPEEQALAAAAASRRLDDAFRGYVSEQGSKRLELAEVTGLVSGVAAIRLAGDSVLDLWDHDGAPSGDRSAARRELLAAAGNMTAWYDQLAAGLTGHEDVPDPLPADAVADGRLIEAVGTDLRNSDGRATATGIRVIWTGDHLDAVRRLQAMVVEPARAAAGDDPVRPVGAGSPGAH